MRPSVVFLTAVVVSATSAGCKGCRNDSSDSGYVPSEAPPVPTQSHAPASASTAPPSPDPVHGLWSQRPFQARSALLQLHERFLTITLLDREAKCDSARLADSDRGIQLTIPSGPDNDFFTGRDLPLPLRLHGATGVSTIPAGHVVARLEPFNPERDNHVRGSLEFRFRTAADDDAPTYASSGSFMATLCDNMATKPSMKKLPTDDSPVAGKVGRRNVALRTMLAYVRDDGYGDKILMLKGYERDVPCHTKSSATPYLYGAEAGPGPDGKHFVGAPLPAQWIMQMRTDEYSERSVHAAHGGSWLQIDSVELKPGGLVKGKLAAVNDDDDATYRFSLSGRFEAKVCGRERKAW